MERGTGKVFFLPLPFLDTDLKESEPRVETSLLLFTAPTPPHASSCRLASPDLSPFAHPSLHIRRVRGGIDAVADSGRAPGPHPRGAEGEARGARLLSPTHPLWAEKV